MSAAQNRVITSEARGNVPRFRAMCERDLDAVIEIERKAYEFPWTRGIFHDCVRVGYVCRLMEVRDCLFGYGVMSVAAGECHLLNICVHPAHQRRGYGALLVGHLLDRARELKATLALLEVRESNQAAYRLYQRLGFDEIGVRAKYYPARKGREDALILAREI